jgi:TetR/AcrR family transcriptional regulator, lmrAB and yxaGH operons repressor
MARPSDAKARFIDTAVILFRERGYHGVGLAEIIAQAKAPKGSFYFHFPGGKEELAECAIRYAGGYLPHMLQKSLRDAPDFRTGIEALVGHLARAFEASNWTQGCPIASILLDTAPYSERLSQAIRSVTDEWIAAFGEATRRFDLGEDPRALAMRILVSLEGAWIMARIFKSREPFHEAVGMIVAGHAISGAPPQPAPAG